MNTHEKNFAPGARIVIRDAEWLVRRVDRTSTGGQALNVVGISELVRGKEAIFLTELEKSVEMLDPAATHLVTDDSGSYQASLLFMESLLRQTPPTDEHLYIGHRAAMDPVPYQLDPAVQALRQPRQRILIADAVGLGKTLEAGILISELIRRGKGKRILVLAIKSMLTQFQQEMWTRFTIPLTRLDSVGLQRIRARIPSNYNPFYYYDRAIISIDTLKQDAKYRTYIENAYWDIIVIDEAHNVALRGGAASHRAKLAKLLAGRSDTLIMLSATPHDGSARSFASLMNMLDPTAIADPDNYGPEEIRGLYIRRFKKDIQNQVENSFAEREISIAHCSASPAEEAAFETFAKMRFTRIDQKKKRPRDGGRLFRITLEKALFSSPAACLKTIRNRITRLRKTGDSEYDKDIEALERLASRVEGITPEHFSKYQKLLSVIRDKKSGLGWTGKDHQDRLVIFTERIETLRFLKENLPRDMKLKKNQVCELHGGMSDREQQDAVDDFGREAAKVRLMIASDVASEGINLHYLSHRMIHFDIPWSLMVFQQRNGRIDRYGQERSPRIVYLVTESGNEKIRGDMRILELLIQKDEQAVKNIGDPAEFMGVYDAEAEERITARAIELGQAPETFEASLEERATDALSILFEDDDPPPAGEAAETVSFSMPSLFPDNYAYLEAAVSCLRRLGPIQADFYPDEKRADLTAPDELRHRFRFLPREIRPEDWVFVLSEDEAVIREEIRRSRKSEKAWPAIHYLWELNPVLEWVNDKLLAAFGRHEAPVLDLQDALTPDEAVFLLSGLIPNRKSHPLVHRWFGVRFLGGAFDGIEPFESLISRTGLNSRIFPNPGETDGRPELQKMLPEAVEKGRLWMSEQRREFEEKINSKLNDQLEALENLRDRQYEQLEIRFKETRRSGEIVRERRKNARMEIDQVFDEYLEWVEETMTTEDDPYIQVVAVLT
ncbi:DEAD/DEAH box helicase [Desulfobacterales bacterium HSG2]|nr:DEAD/DEAH box helicase [Desulfobacterales bacterium HSG2]